MFPENEEPHLLDTIEERYERYVRTKNNFLVIQFGLCTLCWEEKEKRYNVAIFNFWVFPHSSDLLERFFTCQVNSIKFLAEHKFDFNKLIYEGINFLSSGQEEKLMEIIMEKRTSEIQIVNRKDKNYVQEACKKIEIWLESAEESCGEKRDKPCSFTFEASNGYRRKLLYTAIPKKFPNLMVDSVPSEGRNKCVRVTMMSKERVEEARKKELEKIKKELQVQKGFTWVAECISHSRKPLVGHNMFNDLLFCSQQFFGPLPPNSDLFKKQLNKTFPLLIDNRFLACNSSARVRSPQFFCTTFSQKKNRRS